MVKLHWEGSAQQACFYCKVGLTLQAGFMTELLFKWADDDNGTKNKASKTITKATTKKTPNTTNKKISIGIDAIIHTPQDVERSPVCGIFTELAPRRIQSISCNFSSSYVVSCFILVKSHYSHLQRH